LGAAFFLLGTAFFLFGAALFLEAAFFLFFTGIILKHYVAKCAMGGIDFFIVATLMLYVYFFIATVDCQWGKLRTR